MSKKYTLPKGYLSASSIGTLLKCPKQFEFRYIKGIIIPPNAALATGSILHKTFETYYTDAMSGSQRLTPKQAGELSVSTFDSWLDDNEVDMTSDERRSAKDLVPTLAENYVDNVGQHMAPVAVEQKITYTTPDGVDLLGYIDLVFENGQSTGIADYKVTSRKLGMGDLRNSLQFNLYSVMTGITDIQVHNLIKVPGKGKIKKPIADDGVIDYTPNLRVLQHSFSGEQAEHFNSLVKSAAQLITSGIFMPCEPTSWACTPDWCGYWELCRGKTA